jgi:hypothetical protein
MEGIEVNLDTSIGKWLNKLADTVTRLADTQNINNEVLFRNLDDNLKINHNSKLFLFKNTKTNDQMDEIRRLKLELNNFM